MRNGHSHRDIPVFLELRPPGRGRRVRPGFAEVRDHQVNRQTAAMAGVAILLNRLTGLAMVSHFSITSDVICEMPRFRAPDCLLCGLQPDLEASPSRRRPRGVLEVRIKNRQNAG